MIRYPQIYDAGSLKHRSLEQKIAEIGVMGDKQPVLAVGKVEHTIVA